MTHFVEPTFVLMAVACNSLNTGPLSDCDLYIIERSEPTQRVHDIATVTLYQLYICEEE